MGVVCRARGVIGLELLDLVHVEPHAREPGLAARTRIQSGRVLASGPQGTSGLPDLEQHAVGVRESGDAPAVGLLDQSQT